jgi:hypothetical protein
LHLTQEQLNNKSTAYGGSGYARINFYRQNCSVPLRNFSNQRCPFCTAGITKRIFKKPLSVLLFGTGAKTAIPHAVFAPAY